MSQSPILIVDDESANLAMMRQILESDYNLIFARSGKRALDLVLKYRPSLILLDIEMPDMKGYEVCSILKSIPAVADIPVIFITSLKDLNNEEVGFASGCVDYVIKPVIPSILRARIRTHLSLVQVDQLKNSYRDAISMLGEAGHYNDNDTGVHIWRMAAYSKILAIATGWSKSDAEALELAAPMHDMGKIGIPDSILRKPGPLDADEWQIMRTHSEIGSQILSKSEAPIFQLAAEIALYHHERWDGRGYPIELAGSMIPESARIVAIADVFDALTMRRPYKEAWPVERAFEHIKQAAGNHFDPKLVEKFLGIENQILEIQSQWNTVEDNASIENHPNSNVKILPIRPVMARVGMTG